MAAKRVLVVEDDPAVRLAFRLILEGAGYQVSEARHGLAALILIKDSLPHLIITDMVMPEMGGEELIARLRNDRRTNELPILAVTGHPGAKDQASDADAVLEKPFDRLHLLAAVRSLIEPAGQGESE